jgi:outer membrane lipoprotein-sorting protein
VSIFDRRPRLRWAVPVATGALVLAGVAAGTMTVSADSGLPPMTAEELLVALTESETETLSGTVVATADLGLPDLPMSMTAGSDLTSLVSGTNTMRVWVDGQDRSRVALLADAQESDVIRNGRDVWVWSSSDKTAEHYVLPERDTMDAASTPQEWADLPTTPQEAATRALAALDPTTEVTTSGSAVVASRPVYELILTPKQADTLVARVVIGMDAETLVPLRVQVFSTEIPGPAFEIGFTSVDFAKPDADIFAFTPPPGADVTEHSAADADAMDHSGAKGDDSAQPTVIGEGWSQVVIAALPTPDVADPSNGGEDLPAGMTDAAALLQALPLVSGEWGTGHVLDGTLFSAIVTDDGRIAIGAVAPETLGAALAAG